MGHSRRDASGAASALAEGPTCQTVGSGEYPIVQPVNVSEAIVRLLEELGVTHAFGLMGGAIAPFARALSTSSICTVHCRHESGAAFAAVEAYFATGWPSMVFTTTGPGLTNALTGVAAARWEGAKLILVSAATSSSKRGRWGFQETNPWGLLSQGPYPQAPLFHDTTLVDDTSTLDGVAMRLARGLTRPGGFVAHVQIPLGMQTAPCGDRYHPCVTHAPTPQASADAAAHLARLMETSRVAIWVGFGARGARRNLLELVERTGAAVFCSPRGKGIFPEDHPSFVGVTGLGGHESVDAYMREHRPDYTLVLGTRLGEMTSLWDPNMLASRGLVHVDVDPEVFGAAFPTTPTLAVLADVDEFIGQALRFLAPQGPGRVRRLVVSPFGSRVVPRETGPVRPQVLMQAIQDVVVDGSDAVVMAEAGNSFAWASHCLRFSGRSSYRVSVGFGSMGHMVTGVLGAALATGKKAVAIVGDGAMLMNSEVNTAVRHGAPAVWIVLNDSQYGMIAQGMRAIGYQPFETAIPTTDFASIAIHLGAAGVRVQRETALVAALRRAMAAPGPFVVDVCIDPAELAPSMKRNKSLMMQGVSTKTKGATE